MGEQKSELTDLQCAMVEHDDDMARLDRNNLVAQPDGVVEEPERIWLTLDDSDVAYIRAPTPDSIAEKARRAATAIDAALVRSSDYHNLPDILALADIIAAEFGAGGEGW